MKSLLTSRKQIASSKIVSLMFVIVPLWLTIGAANTPACAQASNTLPNAAASSSGDWTQFLRDNMQRWNPYETVLGLNNVNEASLGLKWTHQSSAYYTDPAVVDGVIYVATGNDVWALNASTGELLWRFDAKDLVSTDPAVANGVVYVATLNYGYVYAVNARTGAKLWSFSTNYYVVDSNITVVYGVVYIATESTLYALNANSGAMLWSDPLNVTSTPAVANGVVYIGAYDNNLNAAVYAVNATNGDVLWQYVVGNGPQQFLLNSSPVVANGVVYFGAYGGKVYAVNAMNGVGLWNYATGGPVNNTVAVANGVVYAKSVDGNLYALKADTGDKLWTFDTGAQTLSSVSSPAVANGVVYIGGQFSGNGYLFALNADTGTQLFSHPTAPYVQSPVIANGVVYVTAFNDYADDLDGELYAFSVGADIYLRIWPTPTTVHQGDLITYAFPVWNLGPDNAVHEVLKTQVPEGTTFDYIRISGTPGLGTCLTPPYEGTGEIVCHENSAMAPNTTWTVRLVVKVTAPSGTVITESGTATEDTTDPNLANNTATVSIPVQ